jgi:hypothetical protein
MFKFIKISQIIILTIFVFLIVSGCKTKNFAEERFGEFQESQKSYQEDVIYFMEKDRTRETKSNFFQEKKKIVVEWLKGNNLDSFDSIIDKIDNEWVPSIREKVRESLASTESLLNRLIEKFEIGK